MKKCHNCQTELLDEARFCPECGSEQKELRKCPYCGSELDEQVVFCTQCGKKVIPDTPPVQEAPKVVPKVEIVPTVVVPKKPEVPKKSQKELEAEQKLLIENLLKQNKLELAYKEACKLQSDFPTNDNFFLKEDIVEKYVGELTKQTDELLRKEQHKLALVSIKKALEIKPDDVGLLSRKDTAMSMASSKKKRVFSRIWIILFSLVLVVIIGYIIYNVATKPKEQKTTEVSAENKKTESAEKTKTEQPKPEVVVDESVVTSLSDENKYEGNIGPYHITMFLKEEYTINEYCGYYYYNERPQNKFYLKCVSRENSENDPREYSAELYEYTPTGEHTGTFNGGATYLNPFHVDGVLYPGSDSFEGMFKNAKGEEYEFTVAR